jgi:hypothetical protein
MNISIYLIKDNYKKSQDILVGYSYLQFEKINNFEGEFYYKKSSINTPPW